MSAKRPLQPLRRAPTARTPNGSTPPPTPTTDGDAPANPAAPAPPLLILCLPDERLVRMIGTSIRVFTLGSDLGDLPVVVIAASDPNAPDVPIAAALARIGAHPDDLINAFPRVRLGFTQGDSE